MPWGAVAGAVAGSVANKALSGGSGGGGQTASKEPWAEAAPWLKENLRFGQALQGQYQQEPFSATQRQAYTNQFANSDDFRAFAQSVMGQMSQRPAFDRNNPGARPATMWLPGPSRMPTFGQQYETSGSPFSSAVMRAPAALPAPAPAAAPASTYYQGDFANLGTQATGLGGY